MTPAPAEFARVSLEVARAGAELAADLREGIRADASTRSSKSSDTDLVTDADRATESLIRDELARHDWGPETVLGEEGTAATARVGAARPSLGAPGSPDGPVVWVVDPIDGTTNYVYGQPDWAVSVAATVDGATVAGAVVAPAIGTEWTAALGSGAMRNGVPIESGDGPTLSRSLIATGFGYYPEVRRRQGRIAAGVVGEVRDLRRRGSAAIDLCCVADGSVDGYWERGPRWWDLAAGALIAAESGARLRVQADGDGSMASGWSIVCARAGVFRPLVELLDLLDRPMPDPERTAR